MFFMMNEMRVARAASRRPRRARAASPRACASAERRRAARSAKDLTVPQVPTVAHADARRMLLLQKVYAEGSVHLCLYAAARRRRCWRRRDRHAPGCCRVPHADHQVVARRVGWRRTRAAGARRLRVHARLPARAVVPRQPAQHDPRGAHGIQALDCRRKALMATARRARSSARIAARAAEVGTARRGRARRSRPSSARRRRGSARRRWRRGRGGREGRTRAALANAHEYLNMAGHTVVRGSGCSRPPSRPSSSPRGAPPTKRSSRGRSRRASSSSGTSSPRPGRRRSCWARSTTRRCGSGPSGSEIKGGVLIRAGRAAAAVRATLHNTNGVLSSRGA